MQVSETQKILVVDDDPLMQTLLSKLLNSNGFESYVVDNGASALDILTQTNIGLIITDLNMPGLNGEELCKAIRAQDFGRYIYIIMITAQSGSQSLVNAMLAGADDFISKPLNPTELKARLKSGLRVLELEANLEARNARLNLALNQIKLEQEEAKSTLIGVLPRPALISGAYFNWIFEASSFIGGDIFDYFLIGESHICFYIVDVAGHGVSAAMQAFTIYNDILSSVAEFQLMIDENKLLSAIASEFISDYNNRFLEKKRNDCYFTMFFCLFDTKSGELVLVQAGHPPAIYIEEDGEVIQPIGDGGLPLGMLQDVTYEAISLQMKVGSRLCLYSDGVTECENANAELFGYDKLAQLLLHGCHDTLNEVLSEIEVNLSKWRSSDEPYKDDVTCLIMEYHGDV
jgi:phosphoserine phosphatase RsbU/P